MWSLIMLEPSSSPGTSLPAVKNMPKGPDHKKWKGDEASYHSKHYWIYRYYGKADHCSKDPSHQSPQFVWHNISGKHRRDITDWIQLCSSCHSRLHLCKSHCRRGHELTEENTYIPKNSRFHRICRECAALCARKRRARKRLCISSNG